MMGSYSGTCEIVEVKDEPHYSQGSKGSYGLRSGLGLGDKAQKLPVLNKNCKEFLEDDINRLFEAITLKNSSKGLAFSPQEGTSPLRKHALKRPITMGMPPSPRVGHSESVSLKQALRELSISKASGLAATRRVSKSSIPLGSSEAGRIKTLYNTVVVETNHVGTSRDGDSEKPSHHLQVPKIKTPNPSASSSSSSAQNIVAATDNIVWIGPNQDEIVSTSKKVVAQTLKMELAQEERYSPPPTPLRSKKKLELNKKASVSTKITHKASVPKLGRKGRLQTPLSSSSSVSGNKGAKLTRSTPCLVRPVLRNKTSVKKKTQKSTSAACNNEVNNDLDPSTSELVCQKCRCNMKDASKEPDQISSSKVKPDASKAGFTSSSCNNGSTVTPKVKRSKSMEKGEFSNSSKSSPGEYSSSTSNSDETNLSGSSCGSRPHMSKDVRWEAIRHARVQHGVLDLNHFNLLKKLGCGDIGTVYLAELIGTNCLFAIKVMDNEFLAKRKKMPRAQAEREILGMLDHPFLPTLYAQFITDNLSCLVMEYCPGGDLHVLRQKQPGRNYSEHAARFYVAEVLLALEYLHMLGVVYRDLKPENILVREDGHIMLTDFDLSLRCTVNPTLIKSSSFNTEPAKMSGPCAEANCIQPLCIEPYCQVPCFSPRFLPAAAKAKKIKADLAARIRSLPQLVAEPTDARSNSFVGTHEYLAPEIIKGEGHGAAVDWWTFGIFLYELLYGRTPFKGCGNEETLANVVMQSLRFPDSPLVSFHARDLIRGLLVKEPENRLGSEKGAAEIKQHPFFEGMNWALIRCTVPPELPEIYDFGPPPPLPETEPHDDENETKYLECKATGEHLEFQLF